MHRCMCLACSTYPEWQKYMHQCFFNTYSTDAARTFIPTHISRLCVHRMQSLTAFRKIIVDAVVCICMYVCMYILTSIYIYIYMYMYITYA